MNEKQLFKYALWLFIPIFYVISNCWILATICTAFSCLFIADFAIKTFDVYFASRTLMTGIVGKAVLITGEEFKMKLVK